MPQPQSKIVVAYLEVYGGKVTAASSQYTAQKNVGWRLFDVAVLTDIEVLFSKPVQQLAAWRDNGGQVFLSEENLKLASKDYGVELTPRLSTVETLPISIQEPYEFLHMMLPQTNVALDKGAGGRAEGIVARTLSRSAIAKLRFEDYERHAKRCK